MGTSSGSAEHSEYPFGMQQPVLRKQYSGEGSQLNWPVEAGPPTPQGHNGLSVVTTVWGMTPGTQTSGPRHPSVPYDSMSMYARGSGHARPQTPSAGYPQQANGQPPTFYRQNSLPSGPGLGVTGQYRPTYNPSAPNGNPDYQPPPGALSAAAMVAAAATATATATATMMVHQDTQQPSYHRQPAPTQHPSQMANTQYCMQHYGPRAAGVRMPAGPMMVGREMPNGPMAGGPMQSQQPMAYRRPSPYGNPQQMMMQRKGQYSMPTNAQFAPMTQQPTAYSNPPEQFPSQMRQPANMMSMPNNQPGTYNNIAPPPYEGATTGPYPNQMNRSMQPQAMQHQQPYQNGYMVQHAPQDIKPGIALPPPPGDLQLTFPIRDGTILPPFRLEHNLSVSQHVFHLKEQVFQTLMERQDYEVQLKCFHHEEKTQVPSWPVSVSVSVNNRTLLTVGEQLTPYNRPLYFKNFCVPGKNAITISVGTCCCSHLFVLQLVHRPTVNSILSGLLRKRFLAAEHCINKIKANFANTSLQGTAAGDADGVEQTSVKISLKCPITFRRITLPARGSECRHIQCFDLKSYLQLNAERGLWRCPVCKKNALLEGLEIDQYMWGIVDQLAKTEVEEINIDANASWKPNGPKLVVAKEEDSKDKFCGGVNSWMKTYSPASTNLPTATSYEGHHNPMSPYPTPPNSHNSQGSNSIAHFNSGMYDVGFNSPPDFTGPMSNRSDMSETDKRLAVLHRQQSGIGSPQGPPSNAPPAAMSNYNVPSGGPASNAPAMLPSGPGSNLATGGPPSNTPMSQGPPSNAPASQGPPSNRPASHGGPASNAPVSNTSPNATNNSTTAASSEFPPDISDLVNSASNDSLALDGLDELDLLAYLGPQDRDGSNDNSFSNTTSTANADEILDLFQDP